MGIVESVGGSGVKPMAAKLDKVRVCKRAEVEHLREFIAYAKKLINDAWYFPPNYGYEYMVALALYSKSLTVAEATLVLIEAGYGDEAFAMTRTLIDIHFSLRYIAIEDTHERAKRYAQFSAKNSAVWAELAQIYWPSKGLAVPERTQKIAATFRSPHYWSGRTAKDMAFEPDTVEKDENGKPVDASVAYRIAYGWTSQHVHPTVDALRNHIVQAGYDNFTVRSGNGMNMSHLAAFNVASYLGYTLISFYRIMRDPQPARLSQWARALIEHIGRRRGLKPQEP